MKSTSTCVVLAALVSVWVITAQGYADDVTTEPLEAPQVESVDIMVKPYCFVVGANADAVVIQAEVPYDSVVVDCLAGTPELVIIFAEEIVASIPCSFAEADRRGNLVVKFPYNEVTIPLVEDGKVLVGLVGELTNGNPFSGYESVNVHVVDPKG